MKLTPTNTIWMDGEFVPWDQAQVSESASEPVTDAVDSIAMLEESVTRRAAEAAALFDDSSPAAIARREEAADRAVDLIAARAWQALPATSHGPAQIAAERCISYVVAADTALTGPHEATPDRFALTEAALVLLTHAAHFDSVVDRSRELLGAMPEGRLSMAWRIVDYAHRTLNTARHEWVDADPATVAAAGWVLVERMGRLLIAGALVAEAAKGGPAATTEVLVNAARRYAWNHLRGPAPEAATPTHVQRSADLVRAVLPPDAS